jgi:hypothetical protein
MYFVEGVNCEKSLREIVSNFTQLRKVQTHKLQYLVHLSYTSTVKQVKKTYPDSQQINACAMMGIEHFE